VELCSDDRGDQALQKQTTTEWLRMETPGEWLQKAAAKKDPPGEPQRSVCQEDESTTDVSGEQEGSDEKSVGSEAEGWQAAWP